MLSLGLMVLTGSFLYYRLKTNKPIVSNRERWQVIGNAMIFVGALYNFIAVYLVHG